MKKTLNCFLILFICLLCAVFLTACVNHNPPIGTASSAASNSSATETDRNGEAAAGTASFSYTVNPDGQTCTVTRLRSYQDTDIVVPSLLDGYTVTGIYHGVFANRYELTSITLPETVTEIGSSAFAYCTKLVNIYIPEGVKTIGIAAFTNCMKLKSITIPDSVTRLGTPKSDEDYILSDYDGVFSNCNALETVEIGNGVEKIGDYAFYYCVSLKNVKLGSGIKSIGERAFWTCARLESIEIPEGTVISRFSK